jgi:hypothetical protein
MPPDEKILLKGCSLGSGKMHRKKEIIAPILPKEEIYLSRIAPFTSR